jgi:hypothetical protein
MASVSAPLLAFSGIDSLAPFELSPTSTSVSGSVAILRTRDDGGLEGLSIVKPLPYLSEDEYFTLELKDRLTGSTYLKAEHAAIDGQSWSASARGIVTGQFTFHGLTAKNSYQG